ncbi:hypothetical protein FDA94_24055 [Herbidospora galbida]|uniref:DUF7824 domain-containing protein n=1 Tax=Herbidospora galbida TaxID=2575442 RepID=A0A4U3MC34_9ACTN|nr:DUF6493 family protein [Herbidospora galbida]TKK85972.1 hypothetical protein FDA94_24055 [Herbidospora galbida]
MTWQLVREWIELGGGDAFPMSDVDRKAAAAQLPGYLAGRLREEGRWRIAENAQAFRVAGAACLSGAAQVAAWLDRRELREPTEPQIDAERVLAVLRDRPDEWRRDLAHRLVDGLRAGRVSRRQIFDGRPGFDLAASLAIETGVEPPENDAFVAGWLWRLQNELRWGAEIDVVRDHPLLDVMVARLFQAEGVAAPLNQHGRFVIGALADLASEGRLKRQALIDGCAARFLTHGQNRDIEPFVHLWIRLAPTPAETPVVDLARALPVAAAPLARLAADDLRRYDDAVGLSTELFAETVGALAFRPERKHVTTALQWIATATPERADGALAALALVFGNEDHALQARSVRLARKLAPHATPAAFDPIREAASVLPWDLRTQIAAVFGGVAAPPPAEQPVAGTLEIGFSRPEMPPPIVSAAQLIAALGSPPTFWSIDVEQVVAALVDLTHRDRAATVEALRPWWESNCKGYGDRLHPHADSYTTHNPYFLLRHCVSAIVSPEQSVEASRLNAHYLERSGGRRTLPGRMFGDRMREVIALLESGRTLPVLLATPTTPTGQVDAATLVTRLELLGDHEPPPLDFSQALLRLPRSADPEAVARAGRLTSPAGRRLAAWLRDGGLADPITECGIEAMTRVVAYETYRRVPAMHARMRPARPGLPAPIAELCSLEPKEHWAGLSDDMTWWPSIMPSHREVIAAHVLECFAVGVVLSSRTLVGVLTALVQGEGPVGRATASAILTAFSDRRSEGRASAVDAMKILMVRGEFTATDFGWALAELVRADALKLARVTPLLEDLAFSGAHRETWALLAEAIPALLPKEGERAPTGLADLLKVAVKAAVIAGARAELPGLAEVAARKGGSQVTLGARVLLETISQAPR